MRGWGRRIRFSIRRLVHWGIEDPAAVEGTDIKKERAFNEAFRFMKNRISAFVALPLNKLDEMSLQGHLKKIGSMEGATK